MTLQARNEKGVRLVALSPIDTIRPGFASRSVGLSEINFSDLYCGWLGRNINVKYNTIQHNTTGARWWRGMFGALQLEGCGFESTSSRRVGTVGKSFTRNCSCASA